MLLDVVWFAMGRGGSGVFRCLVLRTPWHDGGPFYVVVFYNSLFNAIFYYTELCNELFDYFFYISLVFLNIVICFPVL